MVLTTDGEIRNRKTDNSLSNGGLRESEASQNTDDKSKRTNTANGGERCNNSAGKAEDITRGTGTSTCSGYSSAGEYAQAVQQWIQQYYWWNNMQYTMSMMPLYAMSMAAQQSMQHQHTAMGSATPSTRWQPRPAAPPPGPAGDPAPGVPPAAAQQVPPPRPANRPRPRHPVVFRIPSLWKRVLAEFIDFVILFIIKLGVTMLAVEHLGNAIDLERYDIDFIFNPDLDYNTAISMTSELIMMEVINRVFICFFETLCLHRGLAGQVGGSTPGKRIMGLRLVSCEEITDQPNNLILVTPAGDVGLWNAFVRAVIKNFSMAFFFPVCLTVFFFQHNRAAYDVISNSAVVEPLPEDVARGF